MFEGNSSSTYHIRAARADLLIYMETPLALRIWRVIRRSVRYRGQPRPDMADGCTERLRMLPGFLWFILSTHRRTRRKARAFYAEFAGDKRRFRTAGAANAYIAGYQ